MKHKSEVFDKFIEFEASVTNDVGKAIGTLRADNGSEYLSTELKNYLKEKGIRHELTVPHSPQQNGVAERMNFGRVSTFDDCACGIIDHLLGRSHLYNCLCEKPPFHDGAKRE